MTKNGRHGGQWALNLGLLVGALLVAFGALELTVRGLDLFPEARRAALEAPEVTEVTETEGPAILTVIHPYLGWTKRPGVSGAQLALRRGHEIGPDPESLPGINLFGFQSPIEDYRQVPEEDFVVGCFGGSVAAALCLTDVDLLVREIERRRPELAGSIRVLNFGSGSYKQPQQLFALSMALLLDVPLDVVVSLDGFNEVASGGSGAKWAYHPLWPTRNALLKTLAFTTGDLSEEEILAAARILELRNRAQRWRSLISGSPRIAALETAKALVGLLILRDEAGAQRMEEALQERTDSPAAENLASLPDECLERSDKRDIDSSCWELIADLWAESVAAMEIQASRHGIPFLHLLQPSQYLPGSKPLSDEEKETAYDEEIRWAAYVREGYPRLRSRLEGLQSRGVRSVDLTGIFENNSETLYRDNWCHLNRRGDEILAAHIADHLDELLPR